MLSLIIAKKVGDVFLRHSVYPTRNSIEFMWGTRNVEMLLVQVSSFITGSVAKFGSNKTET